MTTETFSDYVAQQDARNTIQLNVRKWTLMLCDALRQNYINYSIDSHKKSIYLADAGDSFSKNYHIACIQDLRNGKCDYDFFIEEGRKYLKIVKQMGSQEIVWGFIVKKDDKKFRAGDILKAASWAAPARNQARGNILDGDFSWVRWTGPEYL